MKAKDAKKMTTATGTMAKQLKKLFALLPEDERDDTPEQEYMRLTLHQINSGIAWLTEFAEEEKE